MTTEDLSILKNDALGEILQQFFATSFNAIVITSVAPSYPILYANPQFCQMTGYTLAELRGQSPKILQGEKTNPRILSRLKSIIESGETFHGATINYRKNGEPYPVEWNISPVRGDGGNILYYLSIQKDLTNLKRVVTRLRNTNEYFRHFLMDITRPGKTAENAQALDPPLSNEAADSVTVTTRRALAAELIDTAKLYTVDLRSAANITLFEDAFFDSSADACGIINTDIVYTPISAEDYIARYGDNFYTNDVCGNIADIREQIDALFISGGSQAEFIEISAKLQCVANDIFFLDEFSSMATVLAELAGRTNTFARNTHYEDKILFLLETYQALLDDLEDWIDRVFVTKSATNVHGLDASIISSAKQLIVFLA